MSEKEIDKSLSMQKVLLPGHEPGWNDPPQWAYSGTQNSVATPTKRVLNKRVAFPLASTQAADKESSSQNTSVNKPPPLQSFMNLTTASHPPLIPPSNKDTEATSKIEINKEQALNDVLANLEAVITEHILEKKKAEEVKKRLDVLKAAWLEDKLNNEIHKTVLDLSIALRDGNTEKADQLHVALMMQHATLCSPWIPGIRHVILGLKENNKTEAQ